MINFRQLFQDLKNLKLEDEQFEAIATVILRTPGYLILDYWYQNDILNCIPRSFAWADIVSSGFAIYAVIQGLLLLLLPFEQLVSFYMHYLTVAILAASDTFSRYYVDSEKQLVQDLPDYGHVSFQGFSNMLMLQKTLFDPNNDTDTLFLRQQVAAIVFHTLAAIFVTFFLDLDCNRDKILLLVYLVPIFGRLAGCPVRDLHLTHNFASCFVIFLTVQYIFLCVPRVLQFLRIVHISIVEMVYWYGPLGLFSKLWSRLFVPVQLLLFWMVLFFTQIYSHLVPFDGNKGSVSVEEMAGKTALQNSFDDIKILVKNLDDGIIGKIFDKSEDHGELISNMWYLVLVQSAAEVIYTPLMLAGACVTISYLAKWILVFIKWFTVGSSSFTAPDDLANCGWTEGLTMALLALQTSLLAMPLPERLAVLSIILLIVVTSLIRSMFELVEPLVLSLSTQGFAPLSKHLRAWCICSILFVLPLYMVYMFTFIFDQDFWLLIIISTSVMTSVQVVGLMVTYTFLTWDSISSTPWPSLDDFIYYTRTVTRVFEFIVAVFVVGAGIKETIIGRWSWMSAIVLFIHCYFNVWQRLQQGWNSFLLRSEAVKKISALPDATQSQLKNYNDLCSICYSEMTSAKVTKCSHLYHEACLRKWLYVQDKCPMCHQPIEVNRNSSDGKEGASGSLNSDIEREVANSIPYPDDDEVG